MAHVAGSPRVTCLARWQLRHSTDEAEEERCTLGQLFSKERLLVLQSLHAESFLVAKHC